MRTTIVTGAEGAPFVHGLAALLDPTDELTVIAPIVCDQWLTGLKVSPDLDALLDTNAAPSHAVADELATVGFAPAWHRPTDTVIAGQLIRTELLNTGYSLTQATQALATRRELAFTVLPVSDDRAELHAVVAADADTRAIHITEYLAAPETHDLQDVVLVAGPWSVSAAVTQHLATTDVVILGPSSRTLCIDPALRTPGLLDAFGAETPVLVVTHQDSAPAELVRVSGLGQADPGRATSVDEDPASVLTAARTIVTP